MQQLQLQVQQPCIKVMLQVCVSRWVSCPPAPVLLTAACHTWGAAASAAAAVEAHPAALPALAVVRVVVGAGHPSWVLFP